MKIVLCSAKDAVRERWYALLVDQGYSLYQSSSMEELESLIRRNEEYLLLIHQQFAELRGISSMCSNSDFLEFFFLSDAPNQAEGLSLLQMGAVGYANTYIAAGRLTEAIKAVVTGRVWFEQAIILRLIQMINRSSRPEEVPDNRILGGLSEREKEIALLIVEGLSNQAIGEKLFISERTVKAHLGSIFRKTGAKNRLNLAMMIQRPR